MSGKAMTRTGLVGIELRRSCCRWRVTSLALSIAGWDLISTMATVPEAPQGRHTLPIFRNPSRFTIGGPLYGERVFLSNAEFIEKAVTAWFASRPRGMLSRSPFG